MKSDRAALLIRLPKKLHRRFRVYAAKQGVPMSRLVETAITGLLRRETQGKTVGERTEGAIREGLGR